MSHRHWTIVAVIAGAFLVWRYLAARTAHVDFFSALRHPLASAAELCPLSGDAAHCAALGAGPSVLALRTTYRPQLLRI